MNLETSLIDPEILPYAKNQEVEYWNSCTRTLKLDGQFYQLWFGYLEIIGEEFSEDLPLDFQPRFPGKEKVAYVCRDLPQVGYAIAEKIPQVEEEFYIDIDL